MIFLACDPGLSGAFARYDDVVGGLSIVDMPTYLRKQRHTMRRVLDEPRAAGLIRQLGQDIAYFAIEQVNGLPGQSASGAFTFGYGAGFLVGAATYMEVAVMQVHPTVWKREMGVTRDKNQARARASELLPQHAHMWPLKKHDGRAEAAMLALYAAKMIKDFKQ